MLIYLLISVFSGFRRAIKTCVNTNSQADESHDLFYTTITCTSLMRLCSVLIREKSGKKKEDVSCRRQRSGKKNNVRVHTHTHTRGTRLQDTHSKPEVAKNNVRIVCQSLTSCEYIVAHGQAMEVNHYFFPLFLSFFFFFKYSPGILKRLWPKDKVRNRGNGPVLKI